MPPPAWPCNTTASGEHHTTVTPMPMPALVSWASLMFGYVPVLLYWPLKYVAALPMSGSVLTWATSPRTWSIQPFTVPDTPPGRCAAHTVQPMSAAHTTTMSRARGLPRRRRRRGLPSAGSHSLRDGPVRGWWPDPVSVEGGAASSRTK